MAEAKLAMSLDALIAEATKKKDRKPRQRPSESQADKSGPRKGLNKNRPKNVASQPQQQLQKQKQQQPQPQQQQQIVQRQVQSQQGGQRNRKGSAQNLGVRGGQVQKKSVIEVPLRALRSPVQTVAPASAPQRGKPFQQRQPAPEGKWQHDLYEDDHAPVRRAAMTQAVATSSKLIIKNLHHQVSSDDLLELFSTCGTVKSHTVNYDNSGRSLGTGNVVFETRAEAERAKKEYNNVQLDGQAMEIYFADEATGVTIKKLSSGISVQKPGANGASRGAGGSAAGGGQRLAAAALRETAAASRGGRNGGPRGGRLRSAVVGQAQLDSELQDYMQE